MLEYILVPDNEQNATANSNVNPYLLNRQPQTTANTVNYLNDGVNLMYYQELSRVYSFWRIFLPRIYKNAQLHSLDGRNRNNRDELEAFDGVSNQKFKHAFFSMLTLVCLLLTILGICVYLLKKNHQSFPKTGSYL